MRQPDTTGLRRRFRLAAGILLVAAGVFGAIHSVRAALAQRLYHKTKQGFFVGTPSLEVLPLAIVRNGILEAAAESSDPDVRRAAVDASVEAARECARRCQRAEPLCRENWYFPALAARLQLDALLNVRDAATQEDLRRAALFFAKEALRLNPYDAECRAVYSESLLALGETDEALAFWEPIVEREYWLPENHDALARILLRKGFRKDGAPYLARAVDERALVSDPALRDRLANLASLLAED